MKKLLIGCVAAVMVVAMVSIASAQMGKDPTQAVMEKITRIMNQQSLSAKVIMVLPAGSGTKIPQMEYLMWMNKGKSRVEMDMARMMAAAGAGKGGMPPGMGKMVTITRPDIKVIYMVMPEMNAYAEMAIPDASAGDPASVKVDRKSLGNEKVDSYNCEKMLNTATTKDGKKTEVTTWEAKELGGLPVKSEVETPQGKITMLFKDVKKETPAASLFEPPAGATKHNSMQEMMMSGMMKSL